MAQKPIPAKWRELFKLIPGYDPIATAAPGDWFDPQAADRVCDFFRLCIKHVKGDKAGNQFILEAWQQAVTGCLFGWKRKDGTRRYRECLYYVAKKNGKSAWVAGLILYMETCDGEKGAEIYSAASSRDQATLVFSHAAGMVKQEPWLSDRLTVFGARGGSTIRSIVYEEQMSSYRCLAADANTADGANVHMAAIDELHRHKSPELAEVLQKSTAARSQPLVVYTTTADYNRESLCNTKLKYARQVRENGGDPTKPGYDPAFLPVIYECSKEDDWTDPAIWVKANPNLDVSVPREFLARECRKAQDSPTELNNFLRLHLNIVTDADVAWLTADQWNGCTGAVEPEELEGADCYLGLDLSSTRDLTALIGYFPKSGAVLCRFWVPEDNAHERERKDKVPYMTWARQGYLETTPGNVVDYTYIHAEVIRLAERYTVREIAIDRWQAAQTIVALGEAGFEVVPFGQGYASMSAPTKELERLVCSRQIAHSGHPVLAWMAGNVMISQDPAGNIKPDKKRSTEKIDGIVALIMAIGRAIAAPEEPESVYETRGLLTVC